jgi:hypothetical protein
MNFISKARHWMRSVRDDAAATRRDLADARHELVEAKILSARTLIRQMAATDVISELGDTEFRVFSQFGEDGIIQYLIRRSRVPRNLRTFVEFGVENYTEANTRFLLVNDNWRGLIMDASASNMASVRAWPFYWKYELSAQEAFIDRDNINDLIGEAGFAGEIGLLSVDVDGNDYWVWERISVVDPIIVIVEYNSLFGASRAVTIPYDPAFDRAPAHYSPLNWGGSLNAH